MTPSRESRFPPNAPSEIPGPIVDVDVLVIDDSDIVRRAMMRTLSRAGMTVAGSATPIGASSIIILRNVQVVVIDVNMPALRGDRVVALFRQNPPIKHVRLVLVSALDEDAVAHLAANLAVDAVVPKSQGPDALVRAVSALLRLGPRGHGDTELS